MSTDKKTKIAFTGSREVSQAVYNTRCLQHVFRNLFAIAHGDIMSDRNAELLVGDADGCDSIVQEEAHGGYYEIATTIYSVGEPRNHIHKNATIRSEFKSYKDRDMAMIDEADALIAICVNNSPGTTANIAYAELKKKRVLKVYL